MEVNDLIDWGMTDNYDQELEHSAMAEVPSTEMDTLPPLKLEKPVLLLDACSEASAAEMEASMESNPIGTVLTAAAHSSHSSSPITHLSKLQSDVHLAANSMFTTGRSSDLEYNKPPETSRHHCTRGRQKQPLPMRKPRSPIQGGT